MKGEIGLLLSFVDLEGYRLPGLIRIGPGTAAGTMHDDDGFPAVIHGGEGTVHGTLWSVDEENREAVLTSIDLIHGIGPGRTASPHARTLVMEGGRMLAFSWHWRGPPPSPALQDGSWPADGMPSPHA